MPVKLPYVQELPPKQGYPQVPYKRHIPVRGMSLTALAGWMIASGFVWHISGNQYIMEDDIHVNERNSALNAWMPLVDAERRRHEVKRRKEYMEQLNLNLVATGIYPHLDPLRDIEGKWGPWNEFEYGQAVRNDWLGQSSRRFYGGFYERKTDRMEVGYSPKRAMSEYLYHKGSFPVGP